MAEKSTPAIESSDEWEITTERYVAFIDIMGFKDMVARNTPLAVGRAYALTRSSFSYYYSLA